MDLQAKVKLKNSQLLVQRNILLGHMEHCVAENSPGRLLPVFIISAFVIGFISYRSRCIFLGAHKLKMFRGLFP